jgi:hypothetical protein
MFSNMERVSFEGPAGIGEVDLLDAGERDGPAHNLHLVFELRGDLDVERLADAARWVGGRHESFRTAFVRSTSGWRRLVYEQSRFGLEFIDLSAEEAPEAAARARLLSMSRTRIDRAAPPLIRALLLRLGADYHWFVCHCDHVALDGIAFATCTKELFVGYVQLSQGLSPSLPPARQPREHIAALEALLAPLRAAQPQWSGHSLAAGAPLRPDSSRTGGSDPAGGRSFAVLGDPDAIDALARTRGVARTAPIMAALALGLRDLSGRPEVAFTLIRSGRRDESSRGIVGCLAWGDAFGARIEDDEPLSAVLARADAFLRDDAPWRMLYIPAVNPPSRRVVLNVNRYSSALSLPGLTALPRLDVAPDVRMWGSHDLLVQIFPLPGAIQAVLRYRASLFEPATMERLGAVMGQAIQALLRDAGAPVRTLARGA